RARDPDYEGVIKEVGERGLDVAPLLAVREIARLQRGQGHTQIPRRARDAWRALPRRRRDPGEEDVHRGGGTVERALLELVDRLDGARELLGLARQLLVGLVHGEGERCGHVAQGHPPLQQRRHINRARGKEEKREQRQPWYPGPALGVVAHLLLGGESHVSPGRLPRRLG